MSTQPETIAILRETYRQIRDLERERQALTNRIHAICRRACDGSKTEGAVLYKAITKGDAHPLRAHTAAWCEPLFAAQVPLEASLKPLEKRMQALAKTLPVYSAFVAGVRGFGLPYFSRIIGEAGDLSNYPSPACLWKRMGLAVIGGERQRKSTNKELAIAMGYCPERRAVMWNIGDSLFKAQNPYREIYLERLAVEHAKAVAEGLIPATTTADTVKSWADRDLPALEKVTKAQVDAGGYRTAAHIHNRALRYMEKRLLRDLWRAWRECENGQPETLARAA